MPTSYSGKHKPTPAKKTVKKLSRPSIPIALSSVRHYAGRLRECLIENSRQSREGRLLCVGKKVDHHVSNRCNHLFDVAHRADRPLPDDIQVGIKMLMKELAPAGEGEKRNVARFASWVFEAERTSHWGQYPCWSIEALTKDPRRLARVCHALDLITDPRLEARLPSARDAARDTLVWLKKLGDPDTLPAAYVKPLRERIANVILAYDDPGALPSADQEAAFRDLCEIHRETLGHSPNQDLGARTMKRIRGTLPFIAGVGFAAPSARKTSKPAKRRHRDPKMTARQFEALRVYDREKTYAAVGKHFNISASGARELVKRAQRTRNAIASALAKRATGVSVKPDRKLPEDKHGQCLAAPFKYREG